MLALLRPDFSNNLDGLAPFPADLGCCGRARDSPRPVLPR
jgi:hypothetical protein